ncbi:MAG TPA: AbrB/MazE/SpoVT family DNA-binding domain-containing protein [Rhizomicrobium sp.]|nr:AbrB/MazE/SpoVT family DNA-binding domain-containing protein [Rhizomicrobium sp.]
MKVAKWGNSLAVRIPKNVVDALGLKENDEVQLVPSPGGRTLTVVPDAESEQARRDAALKRLRDSRGWVPADYKFDREEANARGGFFREPDSESE